MNKLEQAKKCIKLSINDRRILHTYAGIYGESDLKPAPKAAIKEDKPSEVNYIGIGIRGRG